MAQPGRDERGQFISNDATMGQAFNRLADVVELISCRIWLESSEKRQIEEGLAEARSIAELADAGERPAKEAT